MLSPFLLLVLFLALVSQSRSHPIDFFRKLTSSSSPTTGGNRLAGWGWSWGWEGGTVSVVDRSPPLTFQSRAAGFGGELSEHHLGYVIPLSSFTAPCPVNASVFDPDAPPNLGCPTLCRTGPNEPESSETWIALVQRGECQFADKVREAQRLGASIVVVGGDDPATSGNPDALVNMYSPEDSSDIVIAATFIKYSDYTQLYSLIQASNTSHQGLKTLSLYLTADSAWEWYSPILTFGFLLLLPSCLTLVTLLVHRVRAARAAQRDRAPEEIVKNLPSRIWNGTGLEKSDDDTAASSLSQITDMERGAELPVEGPSTRRPVEVLPWHELQFECAICLSNFVKGETVRVLPCQHIFHIDEVDSWLIHGKKLCPVCKADVTVPLLKGHVPGQTTPPAEELPTAVNAERLLPHTQPSERTPLLTESSVL